jgi:hypothetical protein
MGPPWAPTGSDDPEKGSGPTLADRPGLGGVSELRRRNTIVSIVDERPKTPITIGELTVVLSGWFEEETDGMVPTEGEIHSVLSDFDLPHLDSVDRLDFDQETGQVFSSRAADALTGDETGEVAVNGGTHWPTSTTARTGDGRTTRQSNGGGDVSADRTVELGVLLVGVAGVALTVSTLNPFDASTSLIPAALIVLFFGYRALTRA